MGSAWQLMIFVGMILRGYPEHSVSGFNKLSGGITFFAHIFIEMRLSIRTKIEVYASNYVMEMIMLPLLRSAYCGNAFSLKVSVLSSPQAE